MRKINKNIENPIDNVLLDYCDKLINTLKKNEITPNMITMIRSVFLLFIYDYLFNTNTYILCILFIFIFYFLDCLDGHLARTTNQVTVVGDIFDHTADFIFLTMIFLYIVSMNYKYKKAIIIIYLLFLYIAFIHMGLQQLNYKENNKNAEYEYIDIFNKFHFLKKDHIKITRYLGCGSFVFIILLIVFYVQNNKL